MKILIFGCGSIGQRHLRCLKHLNQTEVIAFRTQKGTMQALPEELSFVKEVYTLEDAFAWNPDKVIISNPTSLHAGLLFEACKRDIDIFVEKPICGSINEIEPNINIINKSESNILVGYVLRYHPLFIELKKLIKANKVGKILKANIRVGHYLPFWHMYEDYSKVYYARKDLSGGAIRTLSHEIDIAQYLFGNLLNVYAEVDKISSLNIDTDDYAFMLFEGESNLRLSVEIDFLEPNVLRRGEILGELGKIEYAFTDNKIKYINYKDLEEKIVYSGGEVDYNAMYIEQMKEFLNINNSNGILGCGFNEGMQVMKIIDAAEKSSRDKKRVDIC